GEEKQGGQQVLGSAHRIPAGVQTRGAIRPPGKSSQLPGINKSASREAQSRTLLSDLSAFPALSRLRGFGAQGEGQAGLGAPVQAQAGQGASERVFHVLPTLRSQPQARLKDPAPPHPGGPEP